MFVTDVTDKTVFCLIGLRGLLSRLCSDFVFRIDSSLCFSQTFIYASHRQEKDTGMRG